MTERPTSGIVKAASLAALICIALGQPAHADRISNPVASFSGLDKITGRITSFDAYVGETVQFGALQVTPRACYNRDANEVQRVDAFVEVDEITLDRKIKRIFTGWMFADSPALNAVEHPIFDVWLKECKQKTDVPPPKDLKIPPSGPDPLRQPTVRTEEPVKSKPSKGGATAPAQPAPAGQAPANAGQAPAAPAGQPAPAIAQPPTAPVQSAPLGAPAPQAPASPQQQAPAQDNAVPQIVEPNGAGAVPPDQVPQEPVPQDQVPQDNGQLAPLPPPTDVDPSQNPDPNFGLPPEPVPDDTFGNDGSNGNGGEPGSPQAPKGSQQNPSGSGLF